LTNRFALLTKCADHLLKWICKPVNCVFHLLKYTPKLV